VIVTAAYFEIQFLCDRSYLCTTRCQCNCYPETNALVHTHCFVDLAFLYLVLNVSLLPCRCAMQ
jgi:hypothetical protein